MAGATVVPCVCWEWQRDDGGYTPYPPDVSAQIEAAYATYYHNNMFESVVLTGSYGGYVVYFSRNVQKNTASSRFNFKYKIHVNSRDMYNFMCRDYTYKFVSRDAYDFVCTNMNVCLIYCTDVPSLFLSHTHSPFRL